MMKPNRLSLLTTILLAFLAMSVAYSDEMTGKITRYGLWKEIDNLTQKEINNAIEVMRGLALIEETKLIPMKLKNIFIFKYEILGLDGNYEIEMIHWYPENKNGNIETVKIVQKTDIDIMNGKFSGIWGHGMPEEKYLVPGERGYTINYKGKKILNFIFIIQ